MLISHKKIDLLHPIWSMPVALLVVLAFSFNPVSAQQPKINYVYDDLGRLVRVIDENGNAATYHYDAVGNVLRITRETGVPATAVVAGVSSSSWNRGTTTNITINGYNLSCSSVTTATAGVTLSDVQISLDQIRINAVVSATAPIGPTTLEINCDQGLLTVPLSVIDSPPTVLITSPAEGTAVTEGSELTLTAQVADNVWVNGLVWTVDGVAHQPISLPPYQLVVATPLGASSITIEAIVSDDIGQTATAKRTISVQPDTPPTVLITSPAEGATVVEGERLTLSADATDNMQVTHVVWNFNGVAQSAVTTPPYLKEVTVPSGTSSLSIIATATDNLGHTGAASRTVSVIPDPRTTVIGLVLDANNQPVSGANLAVFDQLKAQSHADGRFSIPAVPTVRGPILVSAELQVSGVTLRGVSVVVPPVIGGTTDVGAITLRPIDNSTFPGLTQFTGDNPGSVAVVDLNGDGAVDIVSANEGATSDISVILASGNGTFLPAQSYPAGDGGPFNGPRAVAFSDFDGDGRFDLVTANSASDTISILFGNGDGTFQSEQRFVVGDNPLFVAVADVNGDNKFDILAANRNSGDISVLLGNGDGSFRPELRYTAGDGAFLGPVTIAVKDVNSDDRLDLVSRINGSDDLSILFGNGDGTFQAQLRIPVGASPTALAVADMNGDNRADLVATTVSNLATVFIGNGDGTFQAPQSYSVGSSPVSLVLVDVNGDSIADIITANFLSRDVSVLLGIGNGSFQPDQRFSAGVRPGAVAAAKIDGDSTVDLVLAIGGFDSVALLYGDGDGRFRSRRAFSVGDAPVAVTVVDFNGDGKPDIAAANRSSNDLSILGGNGDGSFQAQQRLPVGGAPVAAVSADLNGDGRLDLVSANSSTDDVSILLGNGDGTFQAERRYIVGDSPFGLAVGDFNGDGKIDVAVPNILSRDISVLLGVGDGIFQPQQRYLLGYPFSGPNSIAVADFNGDGRVDLVAGRNLEGNGDNVIVFIGNGDGTFQLPRPFQGGIGTRSVAVGDLNGDGIVDVATANTISNDVTIFFGNSDGTLQLAGQVPIDEGDPSVISVRDVNGDGNTDLVVVNTSGTVAVLYGNGTGTFQNPQYFTAGFGLRSLAVADVNGDGRPDIVTADELFDEVAVLLRQ